MGNEKSRGQGSASNDVSQHARRSLDAIEAWRAERTSLTSSNLSRFDALSAMKANVRANPSIDPPRKQIAPPDDTTTDSVLVPSGSEVIQVVRLGGEPKEAPAEFHHEGVTKDLMLWNEAQESDDPSISASSLIRNEQPERDEATVNETIVGEEDTFVDDETAIATIATVLGRGREHRRLQENVSKSPKQIMTGVGKAVRLPNAEIEDETTVGTTSASIKAVTYAQDVGANRTIVGSDKTCFDDETTTAAEMTVLGRGRQKEKFRKFADTTTSPPSSSTGRSNNREDTNSAESLNSPSVHTVKEVIVDTSMSPSSSDHVSLLDVTLSSPSRTFVDEEHEVDNGSLLVTPVLDRYRLEPDDTSIGIKVVPNERRAHREMPSKKIKNHLQKYALASKAQPVKPRSVPEAGQGTEALKSVSPYITKRSRTVYRKTPHPKKGGSFCDLDENQHPNTNEHVAAEQHTPHHDVMSKPSGSILRSPFSRFSLPEYQHRSYQKGDSTTARRLSLSASKSQSARSHVDDRNSMSRMPLTAAWIAKHMPEESSLLGSLDLSRESSSLGHL